MSCYISPIHNHHYVAFEDEYGRAAAIQSVNRFLAVQLDARQTTEKPQRRDRTGSRTATAWAGRFRKRAEFEVRTYLYSLSDGGRPRIAPLLEGALGSETILGGGATIASANGSMVTFSQAHNLAPGHAISIGQDLRFVASVESSTVVRLNAELSAPLSAGDPAGPTAVYSPALDLRSVSIYDYWQPATATQRAIVGAAVDRMEIRANGDYHEFRFSGPAAEILSSSDGQGGASAVPAEPSGAGEIQSPVPGHIGQLWLGTGPSRMLTVLNARVRLANHITLRLDEFGQTTARCFLPGQREVLVDLEVFSRAATDFDEIYSAAAGQAPVSLHLQLGEQQGQMCAVYLPALIPEIPEFTTEGSRLLWRFTGMQAVGTAEDEIHVAFG
jgi:hypothetical protein